MHHGEGLLHVGGTKMANVDHLRSSFLHFFTTTHVLS
jgi:hypothetical protein